MREMKTLILNGRKYKVDDPDLSSIKQGEGEQSIELGSSSTALGDNSLAHGSGSVAGSKGYYIKAVNTAVHKIYLTTETVIPVFDNGQDYTDTSFETPAYEVGDGFTISAKGVQHWGSYIDENGVTRNRIEGIQNNVVIYADFKDVVGEPMFNADHIGERPYEFYVPTRPMVGAVAFGDCSFAFGENAIAAGRYSHAEGNGANAAGWYSHAEGRDTTANYCGHAEGQNTFASITAHAEGGNGKALGNASHVEGDWCTAVNHRAHAEGNYTTAHGFQSHAEGDGIYGTINLRREDFYYVSVSDFSKLATKVEHPSDPNCVVITPFPGILLGIKKEDGKFKYTKVVSANVGFKEGNSSIVVRLEDESDFLVKGEIKTVTLFSSAYGNSSHVEGQGTAAGGLASHAEGYKTRAEKNYTHAEGEQTCASGVSSHAEGGSWTYDGETRYTTASGDRSHAEGEGSVASGRGSHAEGFFTEASGLDAHAEGQRTKASASGSHAEGWECHAYSNNSHAEGNCCVAGDTTKGAADTMAAHAEGMSCKACGTASHAEGYLTNASGMYSHSEGFETEAKGDYSHAEGRLSYASGVNSHAEGYWSSAIGGTSHAEGFHTKASGTDAHSEGYGSQAKGQGSHAEGYYTTAAGFYSHVQGRCNIEDTKSTYAHIVGNGATFGDPLYYSNAHTLDWKGNASWAGSSGSTTGADYAEYFEWQDGNPEAEDRVCMLVTLDGDKIKLANAGDDVLGIVSRTAAVIGDTAEWEWRNKYLTDEFGRVIWDMVEEFIEETDGNGEVTMKSIGVFPQRRLNPDYDPEKEYISRANRPEWDTIGMLGKLHVRDDGACQVNGYACVGLDGIATAAAEKTNMRVLSRISNSIVLVLLK